MEKRKKRRKEIGPLPLSLGLILGFAFPPLPTASAPHSLTKKQEELENNGGGGYRQMTCY